MPETESAHAPCVFHVTHTKAGSQWILRILRACVPDRLVTPQVRSAHFLESPVQPGKVYPTLYITRAQFDHVVKPEPWRRFIILRDLRDATISAYYSLRYSHPVTTPRLAEARDAVKELTTEEGLIWMIANRMTGSAEVQASWADCPHEIIRYEDLLERDVEILEEVLLRRCELGCSADRLREAVLANRFDRLTAGRPRGQEDIHAHERKGVAGEWHRLFTPRVKRAFKLAFGQTLIDTGYEKDTDW